MCGIVGYIGSRQAQQVLLNSLKRLEYRGYDSCGIAVCNGAIEVCKDAIRVGELQKVSPQLDGTIGIGHTRWATHGEPSQMNAHPHLDCSGKIAVVHNGIISNFQELQRQLIKEGHNFTSKTDTEVIPHLIEKYYTGNLEEAVEKALKELREALSGDDTAKIKEKTDELSKILQKASASIYQQAAQQYQQQQPTGDAKAGKQEESWSGKPSDDDKTIDADFKVKDDKKKTDKKD